MLYAQVFQIVQRELDEQQESVEKRRGKEREKASVSDELRLRLLKRCRMQKKFTQHCYACFSSLMLLVDCCSLLLLLVVVVVAVVVAHKCAMNKLTR